MSWYLQWSDSIKKRACRYLLQRYLGEFLEEKLTLDQLNVDIYSGTGSVSNVSIDVLALNELGDSKNLPFEFVDGFISGISVSIPWATLFTESIFVEVSGMQITIQPKQRPDNAASMLESMWSSMASSIQLAAECLKNEPLPMEEKEGEKANSMEGLEIFAQAIESILMRVKVKLVDTCIRLEHLPKEGKNGIAMEVRVKNIKYCDETTCDLDENVENIQYPTSFTIKKFFFDGISFYTDEFPFEGRTISKLVMSDGKWPTSRNTDESKEQPDPVLIGKLSGQQEITLKLKLDASTAGPKVDFELNLGSLVFFLSPRQLYLLVEIMQSLASPHTQDTSNVLSKKKYSEKMMNSNDFKKVEQDLEESLTYPMFSYNHTSPLMQGKGWSSPSFDAEEEFLPMHLDSNMCGSVLSDRTTDTSFTSNTSGTYVSKSDTMSQHSPFLGGFQNKRMHEKGLSFDTDTLEETCAFHMRLSSLAVVILNEDLLTLGLDTCELTPSSVSTMRNLSEKFFSQLGKFAFSGNKDPGIHQQEFLRACDHNHIRLLGATVILEGNESRNASYSSLSCVISVANLELLECLVETELPNNSEPQFVELLKFANRQNSPMKLRSSLPSQPDLRLHMQRKVKDRHSRITAYTEFSLRLEKCSTELDLAIFDRISTIVTPQKLCHTNINSRDAMDQHLSFSHAVDSSLRSVKSYYFKVQSPDFTIKFRFPIPDLRPVHERGRYPWCQRNIRKDVLFVSMVDATFVTEINCESMIQEYHVTCKELAVKFQEGDTDVPVSLIFASGDSPNASASDPYPRLLVRLCPVHVTSGYDDINDNEDPSAGLSYFMGNSNKEPSPFMSKKVVHESDTHHRSASEGEELIIPGCKEDLSKFIETTSADSRIHLEIVLPFLSVEFPSKHLYEVIYNRFSKDLSLWQSSNLKNNCQPAATSLHHNTFMMCKSGIQFESDDSDEEEKDDDQKLPNGLSPPTHGNQSHFTLDLNISKGVLDVCPVFKDSKGTAVPDRVGELYFALEDANVFFVSNFKGRRHKNYVCLQVKAIELYHKALVEKQFLDSKPRHGKSPPSYLDPILLKSNKEVIVTSMNPGGKDDNMLVTAMSSDVDERRTKTIKVSCSLVGATLKHYVTASYSSWLTQFLDFFDVVDYPVKGYDSPQVITELYFHLLDSAIDYRPLYIPFRSVITVGNLSISSNIAARTKTSTLRFIAEEGNLFISDVECSRSAPPNLKADYVSVMQLGLFELSLRLSDQQNLPKLDLKASNNILHIRTCADSAAALAQLITYFASDGDLAVNDELSNSDRSSQGGKPPEPEVANLDLSESTVERLNDMMEDAMREISSNGSCSSKSPSNRTSEDEDIEIFFFPDEGSGANQNPVDWGGMEGDDFCVLEQESGIHIPKPEDGQPAVHVLTQSPVDIIENYFNVSVGKSDLLHTPKSYPSPTHKYILSDMTLVWHMYGGEDFSNKSQARKNVKFEDRQCSSSGSSPINKPRTHAGSEEFLGARYAANVPNDSHRVTINTRKERNAKSTPAAQWIFSGGPNREHDVLMELQFNKVKFLHEIYPEQSVYASRQVLLIHEFEIRDKLSTSNINKFLYQYSSESSPRQSNANMMVVKVVHLRPDPKQNIQETCLKVSLLPLRLNIDQDSLQFLVNFVTKLSGISCSEEDGTTNAAAATLANPVMGMDAKDDGTTYEDQFLSSDQDADQSVDESKTEPEVPKYRSSASQQRRSPTFVRNFVFSPEVPIRIDYEGKHVDLTHGPLAGLLMGLGQLNCLQIRLKQILYKHGLLGFDKLVSFAVNEWIQDIKKTQVPCLLGGVGPMHALVQLFQGVRDLFWLPIEQYQKDGRIVRGLQRGANSFTTSTAIAALELTARIVQAIQSIAEAAFDMVSPGPSVRRVNGAKLKKPHSYSHPADIREGVANAYILVKEGLGETAETIVRVASAEAEQKGAVGAVGGILRQIPPSVVQQLILASAATSNLLSGVRSQLAPDSRREAANKWKCNVPD
ncbi:autophagy-specific gene 2 [Nesidiocoris tenuis]|uniref:Autophagy-related protein 2 n=1 Tax=Nesidiocoris tenuis TaxID=355587 RepID=A0ABN7AKJ2_9HEMI|nr:autophagy-specific gene 2 [Nesidiocoris tenuis]